MFKLPDNYMDLFSKYFKTIFLVAIVFTSCNNAANENNSEDTVVIQQDPPVVADSITTWQFDSDTDVPVKSGKKYFDSLTAEKLVSFTSTDKVKLEFVKISQDTIFVRIKDSEFLSQRMGTTGARSFLSVATYMLTELKGIHYVNFDFTEGDHAVPGTYNRGEFVAN
jgi:hypothetical protein